MKNRQRRFFLIPVLLVLLVDCTPVKTPDEVARQFWEAVAGQDENTARRYATEDSRAKIDLSPGRWRDAAVTLGEIRIEGNDATIETRLVMPGRAALPPVELRTVLRRENDRWKVDYEKTMDAWRVRNALSDLIKELGTFNRQLSGNVDQALSDLKQNLPEIEKEFEVLGDSVGKALEETLQEGIPELQKGVEAFMKSLEKALEEVMKRKDQVEKEQSEGTKTL